MATHAQMQYPEQDETTFRWIVIFVLVSLLAHAVFILGMVLIARHMPEQKLEAPPPPTDKVTLTMIPPPPPAQKHVFMTTPAQPNTPPKDTLIESDHDTRTASQSKTSRSNDSVMPDVNSQVKHASDLHTSPNSPTKARPAPPTPQKTQAQPKQQTPPQPQQATKVDTTPPQPKPQPQKAQPVAQPQVDPRTGLPLLPAINAKTMAQQNPAEQTSGAPPLSMPAIAPDIQGRVGLSGAPTPEAMATDLGRYKAYIYSVVGSYWYPAVDQSFQLLPVGMVRIRYTIHSDGTLTDVTVLEGDNANLQQLMVISRNALVSPAPFKPFPEALRRKIGDSYTDDFTFSVY